jgi:hypothetical protein
LAN